jgi:UDP-N-acetylmuramate dehydrogenase
MEILENILMKDFTTFRTGGLARWFCHVRSVEGLKAAILFAKDKSLPFFVLGGGSNLLVSDDGFPGVVIKMEIGGIDFEEKPASAQGFGEAKPAFASSSGQAKENDAVHVTAGAGENWDAFVAATVARGLVGLENLSLIPGSVGATPVQNVGAYGREVKDIIEEVEAFDTETFEIKKFSREECRFGYRDSFFKHPEGKKYIITHVTFALQKNGTLKTDYKDVQEYFLKHNIINADVSDVRDAIVAIRTAKLPDIREYGTAGSFFKNPIISRELAEEVHEKYPDIPLYPAGPDTKKISAGWLLDRVCGLKGIETGHVGTYKNQALVIVNHGGATTKEVVGFAESLREQVKNKTGIVLEFEVQIIN